MFGWQSVSMPVKIKREEEDDDDETEKDTKKRPLFSDTKELRRLVTRGHTDRAL